MSKYIVRILLPDKPPQYIERGMGIGGVKLCDSPETARKYENTEAAEKFAEIARKHIEGCTAEIVENSPEDEWCDRFEFVQSTTGMRSIFQMRKAPDGLRCRYLTFNGTASPERPRAELDAAVIAWTDCIRAWLIAQIHRKGK